MSDDVTRAGVAGLAAGRDYPRSYREFVEAFPDEDACGRYLEELRWPNEFVCPACGATAEPWRHTRGRLVCPGCRHQTTVTAGTILDRTRTPLITWFEAAWHLTTAKNGMSATTLERTIGSATGWRGPCCTGSGWPWWGAERAPLSGDVEVDETLVGGVEHGRKRGRGTAKSVVVIAVEIKQPKGFGRARMRQVPDASAASLVPFVRDVVAPGSVVLTDGWMGYNPLPEHGYVRKKTVLSASGDPAHVSMPGVHRVASLLKRWVLGTHQGSVDPEHLQSYLEEFTFRFNRRTSRSRGLVFRRLLEQSVITGPVTEADVTHGYPWQR